ncbi:hypothetical protein FRB99_003625, partial [Tulasnella sp. 403]
MLYLDPRTPSDPPSAMQNNRTLPSLSSPRPSAAPQAPGALGTEIGGSPFEIIKDRNGLYHCPLCKKSFLQRRNLTRHLKEHEPKSAMQPAACSRSSGQPPHSSTTSRSSASHHTAPTTVVSIDGDAMDLTGGPSASPAQPIPTSPPQPTSGPAPDTRRTPTYVEVTELAQDGIVVLKPYDMFVCKTHKYGILGPQLQGHLHSLHNRNVSNNTMEAIIAKYGLKTKKEDVPLPPVPSPPLPILPTLQGWRCNLCNKLSTAQDVRAHQHQDHSGQTVRPIPVFVQPLFPITHGGLIEVTGPLARSPSTVSVVVDQYMESLQDLINPPILAHDDPRQIHPFLQRSGWASWLQGLGPQDIKNLQGLLNPQEGLVALCREFLAQMEPWIASSETYITRTHLAAKLDTQTNKLFKPIQCKATEARYSRHWGNFLALMLACSSSPFTTKTPAGSTIVTPLNLSSCRILLTKPLQEALTEFQNPPEHITVAHRLGQLKK